MVLVLDKGGAGRAQLWGLLGVLLATAAWGVDNTLSRSLAERDPGQVVMSKAVLVATATDVMALGLGEPLPPLAVALALFAITAMFTSRCPLEYKAIGINTSRLVMCSLMCLMPIARITTEGSLRSRSLQDGLWSTNRRMTASS